MLHHSIGNSSCKRQIACFGTESCVQSSMQIASTSCFVLFRASQQTNSDSGWLAGAVSSLQEESCWMSFARIRR